MVLMVDLPTHVWLGPRSWPKRFIRNLPEEFFETVNDLHAAQTVEFGSSRCLEEIVLGPSFSLCHIFR